MTRRAAASAALLLAALLLAGSQVWAAPPPRPAPAAAPDVVIDCYLTQSSAIQLGQFVRHLRVQPKRGVVSISDGVRGGTVRFLGDGHIVSFDADRLVYDFASYSSSGRTVIDRKTGGFQYSDGHSSITGSCQEGGL